MSLIRFPQGLGKCLALTFLLALGAGLPSCKKDDAPRNSYAGENKIYLALPDGTQSQILASDHSTPIEVVIRLTQRTQEPLQLELSLEGDGASSLRLPESRVTIPAGTSTLTVRLLPQPQELDQERTATLHLRAALPVEGTITFQILPARAWTPTSAQRALIEGYRAQGLDLAQLLGYHTVSGSAELAGYGDYDYGKQGAREEARTVPIQNEYMLVELSEHATASQPILKISYNAFGLNKLFKQLWYAHAIGDEYNVNIPEEPTPSLQAAQAINWSTESPETFNVVLDNLRLDPATRTITFTGVRGEGVPQAIKTAYGELFEEGPVVVPFTFETSVWDRLLAKVTTEPTFLEQLQGSPIFNVYSILQNTGIDTDQSEDIGTTDGRYIAPAGSFDLATRTLSFVFPFHLENSERYSRITVSTQRR